MKTPAETIQSEASVAEGLEAEVFADVAAVGPSAEQVALSELRSHLTAWMSHEPGARLGSDPEELHQLRVAARRIEATLELFKHQLPTRLVHARKGAKGVLRALGSARDLDVQLAELRQYCTALPPAERAAATPLKLRLEEDRTRARTRMLGTLDSEATRHWLEALNLASADFTAAAAPGAPQAATVMPARVRGRYRKLKKAVRKLSSKSRMEEYHTVRRRAKQLRYAIECGTSLFGKQAEEMLKVLRRLQDRLGAQQDAHMAKNRLAALAADGAHLPPETLFLMGRLAEHHLAETQQARKTLARAWRRVNGKRWKALRARMQELSEGATAAQTAIDASRELALAQSLPVTEETLNTPLPGSRPLRH
jgi:CHAD domain-containing protein